MNIMDVVLYFVMLFIIIKHLTFLGVLACMQLCVQTVEDDICGGLEQWFATCCNITSLDILYCATVALILVSYPMHLW